MRTIEIKKARKRLQLVGYYQIIGGALGMLTAIWALFTQTVKIEVFMYLFALCLYLYSMYCGYLLLQDKHNGIKLSIYNQAIQVIEFAMFGYAYGFVAGIPVQIGIDLTEKFTFHFFTGVSKFYMSINKNPQLLQLNINFFAAFLIYHLQRAEVRITLQSESN